jgi:hypothetical protein
MGETALFRPLDPEVTSARIDRVRVAIRRAPEFHVQAATAKF